MATRRAPNQVKILLAGGIILCLTSWLLLFLEVESVLGSGPVIFATGLAMVVFSRRVPFAPGVLIGSAHCAICILLTCLVNSLNWSPGESFIPFVSVGAVYCATVVPFSILAYRRVPEVTDPEHCANCGYLLTGLTEPRCPECGTAFDPAMLPLLPSENSGIENQKQGCRPGEGSAFQSQIENQKSEIGNQTVMISFCLFSIISSTLAS